MCAAHRRLARDVCAAGIAGAGVILAAPPVGLSAVAFVAFVSLLLAATRRPAGR